MHKLKYPITKKGVTKAISGDIIVQLCEACPQVNANYILTGKGPMFIEDEDSGSSQQDTDSVSLSYDELSRLYETTVSRYERLFGKLKKQFNELEQTITKARDELEQAILDVKNVLEEKKTEEEYFLMLLKPAMEILRKYDFKLPIISNYQYNLRLKVVQEIARIKQSLHSHMARHSFAVMALNMGVSIENLAKMMGHTDIKTTQIYAKVLNKSVQEEFEKMDSKL